ncbi:hypothetical protein ACFLT8_03610 [Chloroflexota bacterium]
MKWLGMNIRKLFRDQRGIGLVEVLLAMAFLGLISTVIIKAYSSNYRATLTIDKRMVATNLAAAYFEAIRALPYDNGDDPYPKAGKNLNIPS